MIPIANLCEAPELRLQGKTIEALHFTRSLFQMRAGASSGAGVEAYVWARSFEDALEVFVDWLDDENLCGMFVTVGIAELEDAADELGLPRAVAHDDQHPNYWRVVEKAEEDLTLVTGHTTMKNCPNPGYFLSYDWGGEELDLSQNLEVARESYRECRGHAFLPGDVVWALADDAELEITRGTKFQVMYTDTETVDVTGGDWEDLELESGFAAEFLGTEPPLPARRTGYSVPDEEEKKRQMDFFFPKSTLPKPREGGGGFLGVSRFRNPFRRER
jgi:hypothetical protein